MTAKRTGWTRIDAHHKGGCGSTWKHDASGWIVNHCGHPTALWPWYGASPHAPTDSESNMLLHGGIGLGLAFQFLDDAMKAVEHHLADPDATPRQPYEPDDVSWFEKPLAVLA